MKGTFDFGTATVVTLATVKLPSGRQRVVPDERYAAIAATSAYVSDGSVFVVVPIKTVNPLNLGNKDAMRWRMSGAAKEREAVLLSLLGHEHKRAALAKGCVVTITRISAGRLDPIDGLPSALKHVRDAVAMWLLGGSIGEMDESPLIEWRRYEQRSLGRGRYGVIVSIARKGT